MKSNLNKTILLGLFITSICTPPASVQAISLWSIAKNTFLASFYIGSAALNTYALATANMPKIEQSTMAWCGLLSAYQALKQSNLIINPQESGKNACMLIALPISLIAAAGMYQIALKPNMPSTATLKAKLAFATLFSAGAIKTAWDCGSYLLKTYQTAAAVNH